MKLINNPKSWAVLGFIFVSIILGYFVSKNTNKVPFILLWAGGSVVFLLAFIKSNHIKK